MGCVLMSAIILAGSAGRLGVPARHPDAVPPARASAGAVNSRRRCPMIIFWISAVPSPMRSMGASR